MRFKDGAKISISLQPEILDTFLEIQRACDEYGVDFVVTSGVEGRHKENSKHYEGLAIDVRSREFIDGSKGKECASFCETLRERLDSAYEIIQESNHIHIEYDPV